MKLQDYMDKKNLDCKAFASMVGTTPQQVTHWYFGVFSPRLAHAVIIYKLTNGAVSFEDLLTAKDKKKVREIC